MKIQSNGAPGVLVVSRCYWLRRRGVILIVGKRILCNVEVELLGEEIIALLSSFYLVDVDYPQAQEMGLSVLQYVIFKDTNVPKDIACQFKTAIESYNDFKDSMQ